MEGDRRYQKTTNQPKINKKPPPPPTTIKKKKSKPTNQPQIKTNNNKINKQIKTLSKLVNSFILHINSLGII